MKKKKDWKEFWFGIKPKPEPGPSEGSGDENEGSHRSSTTPPPWSVYPEEMIGDEGAERSLPDLVPSLPPRVEKENGATDSTNRGSYQTLSGAELFKAIAAAQKGLQDSNELRSHPPSSQPPEETDVLRATRVIAISAAMIVALLFLACNSKQSLYPPLKWGVSLGLLYVAGFYLQPKRHALIQPPDEAGKVNYDVRGEPIELSEHDARSAGWIEVDRAKMVSLVWKNGRSEPITDERIKRVMDEPSYFPPISQNTATALLLAAVFINPLGLRMSKSSWIAVDLLIALLLVFSIRAARRERSKPEHCLLRFDSNGRIPRPDTEFALHLKRLAVRSWPAFLILVLLLLTQLLSSHSMLYRSEVSLFSVLDAAWFVLFASAILTYAIIGIMILCWKIPSAYESSAVLFIALFMAFGTSKKLRTIVDPPAQRTPDHEDARRYPY